MHLFRSQMVILPFFVTVLCYPYFFLNEGTVCPCFYGLEVLDVEGQNHIGHICLFTTYLTLLISYNKTGVNWSFVFKKQGQNRTKQKGGAKSPLALKTGVRMPKPQFFILSILFRCFLLLLHTFSLFFSFFLIIFQRK